MHTHAHVRKRTHACTRTRTCICTCTCTCTRTHNTVCHVVDWFLFRHDVALFQGDCAIDSCKLGGHCARDIGVADHWL